MFLKFKKISHDDFLRDFKTKLKFAFKENLKNKADLQNLFENYFLKMLKIYLKKLCLIFFKIKIYLKLNR